jgi:hypothetical protein
MLRNSTPTSVQNTPEKVKEAKFASQTESRLKQNLPLELYRENKRREVCYLLSKKHFLMIIFNMS